MSSQYQEALELGYSPNEIMKHLETHPKYSSKIKEARELGYSDEEIGDFLSSYQPQKKERSGFEKAGRIAGQYALGVAENALLPYEFAVAPLASKEAQLVPYRENLMSDIERLSEQKQTGVWSSEDEQDLQSKIQELQNPEQSMQNVRTADIGIRGLAEKATGLNLHPEDLAEKAASWTGFVKNPKNIVSLYESGIKLPELYKAIAPTGKETLRGLGAGTALQMAEEGNFGPIGTMAVAIIGDIAGHTAAETLKTAGKILTAPKQSFAEIASKFTPKDKLELQKGIIKDFRDAGIQADLGTTTGSNLVKMTQSRLAQSGLVGKSLDEFKDRLTNQIKEEYKAIADNLGEAKTSNIHETGQIVKQGIKDIREADLAVTRDLYKKAESSLKDKAFVDSKRLANAIEKLEKQLKPGAVKSGEQKTVLDTLEKLKRDFYDSSGTPMYANVKDLINNKIALGDIINYEVQGGAKQLLKGIVSELDRAIISHGKDNPSFAKNYINANKRFSEHAKTFRNKNIDQLLREQDPAKLMNKMDSVQGIRDMGNVLNKSPQGKEIFNQLKRVKLDKVIGDNLVDSTTQQAKLGTFSKLLEKGKNKEIIKEILGPKDFKRLERLQRNAGKLADAAQKFYNASKSGVVATDMAIIAKGFSDLSHLFYGNPWPLTRTIVATLATRQLSNLLADPQFLRLVEDAILKSEKKSPELLIQAGEKLKPYFLPIYQQEAHNDHNSVVD